MFANTKAPVVSGGGLSWIDDADLLMRSHIPRPRREAARTDGTTAGEKRDLHGRDQWRLREGLSTGIGNGVCWSGSCRFCLPSFFVPSTVTALRLSCPAGGGAQEGTHQVDKTQ
jgi:hypothetical protein